MFYSEEPQFEGATYLLRWGLPAAWPGAPPAVSACWQRQRGPGLAGLPGCAPCTRRSHPPALPAPAGQPACFPPTHARPRLLPLACSRHSKDKRSLMLGWICVLAVKVEPACVLEPDQLQVGALGGRAGVGGWVGMAASFLRL